MNLQSEVRIQNPETSHPKLEAIRDSLLALHNQTSVNDFSNDPTGHINLLDEIDAICSERRAILKTMTLA
jgi:hypothetical protein